MSNPLLILRQTRTALPFLLLILGGLGKNLARGETFPAEPSWPEGIERALAEAGTNRAELSALLREVPDAQRDGFQFLLENMPRHDLQTLSGSMLLENITLAYRAREEFPWGGNVPRELFLNDVLPYANLNEQRESWRKTLHDKCVPLVKGCKTPGEAAQRLNEKLFGLVNVKYSTKRKKADQSPSESMETGLASCTGLSILLVDACRSVGVPARLAGIPNWIDNRGNHTWVEIWDQVWHFTGAAEPDTHGLDHAWFQEDAALAVKDSKEHAIYAASFRKTPLPFPLVWARDLDYVSAVNVTDVYTHKATPASLDTTRVRIKVLDRAGGNRVAAKVHVSDQQDASKSFEGTSRDEKSDENDLLSFELSPDHTYQVEVKLDGEQTKQELHCQKSGQQLMVIYLAAPSAEHPADFKPLRPAEKAKLEAAASRFFGASAGERAGWKFDRSLESLLRNNEPAVRQAVWQTFLKSPLTGASKSDFESNRVHYQNYASPYTVRKVGVKPLHGWPLFIAMHGGGNVPKDVNDSQWVVMQRYYRDQPCVPGYLYLALRAPNDTWNGFYDDYVYPLVDNLIRQFLIFGDVDPNKVFIMGYSHGGYGAFAIGPKMPDHFAAIHASAAAPTEGETSAKTLRNTQFAYMVGEKDHDYGRLERCQAFDEQVRKLRGERTDIYPVTLEYEPGIGHRGLPDRDKIKDMYPAVRNPVPRELTWEITDGIITHFFWLEVAKPEKKQEITAICRNNQVNVTTTRVSEANMLLDSRMIDFKRPVMLKINGRRSKLKLQPSLLTLCQTFVERGDPDLAFSARVRIAP